MEKKHSRYSGYKMVGMGLILIFNMVSRKGLIKKMKFARAV